jgi:hypothetical protein
MYHNGTGYLGFAPGYGGGNSVWLSKGSEPGRVGLRLRPSMKETMQRQVAATNTPIPMPILLFVVKGGLGEGRVKECVGMGTTELSVV